jgi:uncharacterized protein (DUF2147 family)
MKRAIALAMTAALGVSACQTASAPVASPQGRWVTASRNLVVEIAPCGELMCGTVAKVLANYSMSGAGRSSARPLPVGFRLITDMHRDGDHWTGRIFDRENGRTYDLSLRELTDLRLEVRPYVVLPLAGRTQIWTRSQD